MEANSTDDKRGRAITVVASAESAGERVDRFLAGTTEGVSRSRIKALIEAGQLTCGGAVLREPAEAVRAGATYVFDRPAPVTATQSAQAIPLHILFEDGHLIVLDKQAGLVTHPAPGNEDGTLVNALLAHCGDALPGIGGERRPGIVHRLDKDTSGVIVVAKTEAALAALSADFAKRALERSYLALVWGRPAPAAGRWTGAIGRDPRERKRMAVVERGGKQASTGYERVGGLELAVSLLRCRLETGRTHQIRVHAAAAGHPLVGDPVYVRRTPGAAARAKPAERKLLLEFPRQALHASVLGFRHPATGEPLRFETPPPTDLQTLLTQCDIGVALHHS